MAEFPKLVPTSRVFTLGQLPMRKFTSLAGTVYKRVYGNRITAHRLSLEFANIKDSVAKTIVEHYYGETQRVGTFNLPGETTDGMDDFDFRSIMRNPDGTNWVYAGPPQVRSVFPGISTVSVELESEPNY